MISLFRLSASFWRIPAALLAGLILLVGQQGNAQRQEDNFHKGSATQQPVGSKTGDKTPAPTKPLQEKEELHLYRCKYVKSAELATLISTVYANPIARGEQHFRITVDESGNRVLVLASAARWNEIQSLIQKLDIETASAEDEQRVKLIPLERGLSASDESLQSVLNMLFANRPTMKYALDQSRNVLILKGDARAVAEVQQICMALAEISEAVKEQTQRARQIPTIQTRLLWLVDCEEKEGGTPLTGDVLKIVPVLAKLGFNHPRIMGNSLVTSQAGSFKSSGSAVFGIHGEAYLHLSGTCRVVEGNRAYLNLDLRINSEENAKGETAKSLAAITTEIQAPLGHYVILGMTPTNGRTSAFVVQVNVAD